MIAIQETMQVLAPLGPQALQMGLKVKDIPAYVARLKGVPESLIMSDADRTEMVQKAQALGNQMQQNQIQQNAAMNATPPNTTNQAPAAPLSAP